MGNKPTYLGETGEFWLALRESLDNEVYDAIKENTELRAKVHFYEETAVSILKFKERFK